MVTHDLTFGAGSFYEKVLDHDYLALPSRERYYPDNHHTALGVELLATFCPNRKAVLSSDMDI